jgi:hypothetical protein
VSLFANPGLPSEASIHLRRDEYERLRQSEARFRIRTGLKLMGVTERVRMPDDGEISVPRTARCQSRARIARCSLPAWRPVELVTRTEEGQWASVGGVSSAIFSPVWRPTHSFREQPDPLIVLREPRGHFLAEIETQPIRLADYETFDWVEQ